MPFFCFKISFVVYPGHGIVYRIVDQSALSLFLNVYFMGKVQRNSASKQEKASAKCSAPFAKACFRVSLFLHPACVDRAHTVV